MAICVGFSVKAFNKPGKFHFSTRHCALARETPSVAFAFDAHSDYNE